LKIGSVVIDSDDFPHVEIGKRPPAYACSVLEGRLTGPLGAKPTKAAIDVPTPSMGFEAEGTSSTEILGMRRVNISLIFLRQIVCPHDKTQRRLWPGSDNHPRKRILPRS
jgi:hypothetical protein